MPSVHRFRPYLAVCALLMGLSALANDAAARVHLLQADGAGDFPTIQAAVDAAIGGEVIALRAGVYAGPGNRDIDLAGKAVTITGLGPDPAVIDCENLGRGFLCDSGEGPGTILHGLKIVHAGSGVVCNNGSPTLISCVIESCTDGVEINDANPKLVDCTIRANSHSGVRTGFASQGELIACRLNANQGSGIDGNYLEIDIVGGEIRGNSGGIRAYNNAFFWMAGTLVAGNRSAGTGGGIYCSEGVFSIRSSTISGNSAQNGGGLSVDEDADLHIMDSILWGNCADDQGDEAYLPSLAFPLTFDCSDVNVSGIHGTEYVLSGTCITADPRLCDPEECGHAPTLEGRYGLARNSPCVPEASPCGRLIGARGVDCPIQSAVDPDPPRLQEEPAVPSEISGASEIGGGVLATEVVEAIAGQPLRVDIYDARGALCRTLFDGRAAGRETFSWDGRYATGLRAPGGIYFMRVTCAGAETVRRLVVVR